MWYNALVGSILSCVSAHGHLQLSGQMWGLGMYVEELLRATELKEIHIIGGWELTKDCVVLAFWLVLQHQ